MEKNAVNKMVTAALLISISVVLSRFFVVYLTPDVRINFGNIPIMLVGILFGPIYGAVAGAGADIIGSVFLSALGWYPPLTVSAAIMGLVPGLMKNLLKKDLTFIKTISIVFTADFLGPILWTTFWLSKLYNTPIWTLALTRVPLYIGMTVLESIIIFGIIKVLIKEKREK